MWKLAGIIGATLSFVGCASLPQSLQEVRVGMDKGETLQLAGNPKFTFREKSQDHWAYFYSSSDKEWRRDVVFENGKVVRVTQPLSKEKWQKDLENASSLEEYESVVREHQKKP